jgi:hypothetical protein
MVVLLLLLIALSVDAAAAVSLRLADLRMGAVPAERMEVLLTAQVPVVVVVAAPSPPPQASLREGAVFCVVSCGIV